jgi:hypothetical protein
MLGTSLGSQYLYGGRPGVDDSLRGGTTFGATQASAVTPPHAGRTPGAPPNQ